LPQLLAGVDAELGPQDRAGAAQRAERVALPARPVQRQRQQPPRVLAQRVVGDQGLQLGHRLGGPSRREHGLGAALQGQQPQLVQPRGLAAGPVLVGELRVGRTPPQAEGLVQRGARLVGPAAVQECGGRGDGGLEAVGVHGPALRPERVAAGHGHQQSGRGPRRAVRFEGLAQGADEGLDRARGAVGRVVPEVVDEPGERYGSAAGHQQPGQHGAVPQALEVDLILSVPGGEGAQHPELHLRHVDTLSGGGAPPGPSVRRPGTGRLLIER
jgi:hypothetical protein